MGLGVQHLGTLGEAPEGQNGRKLLTINKACEAIGVSRRTLYNWMASGKLRFVRTPSGGRRVYEDSLVQGGMQGAEV